MAGVGRAGKSKGYVVSLVDDAVLRAVATLHFVTIEQITRLLYSPSSRNHVGEILKRLADANYLQRTYLAKPGSQGRAKSVYLLARKGMRYLEHLGLPVDTRARPSEHAHQGAQFLLHTLAVNEVLIALLRLTRAHEQLSLASIRHERDLKRSAPVKVDTAGLGNGQDREAVFVVPDAWADVRIARDNGRITQFPLWFELDRGTESVAAWKRKIRGIVAYYQAGHYERLFGTRHAQFAVLVEQEAFASQQTARQRLAQLRRWTAEELERLGKRAYARAFRFTLLPPPDTLKPDALFLSPRWEQLFTAAPVPLLALPQRPEAPTPPGSGSETVLATM